MTIFEIVEEEFKTEIVTSREENKTKEVEEIEGFPTINDTEEDEKGLFLCLLCLKVVVSVVCCVCNCFVVYSGVVVFCVYSGVVFLCGGGVVVIIIVIYRVF